MNKYMVYLDDGENVFKVAVPAESVESACKFVQGNGEVIAVKDVTDDYQILERDVIDALLQADFGDTEIDFIARALREMNITHI